MKKEIEKKYTKKQTIKILERLVESLKKEKPFRMQIKGNKVYVSKEPEIEIEYEKDKKEPARNARGVAYAGGEKIEIEIKW